MTAQPAKPHGGSRRHSQQTQDEVARSLERELRFLSEERQERALQLGLDMSAKTPKTDH
ncbi:hypothetical protein JQ559_30165 [Bradyrhizobium viridifuturi]|uniref:hypothetical protein n=1 Tax=Bradyrhizobium TaxID=374 RepID=UPI000396B3D9|nr:MULTISPECIES: hypothetical protein [Bradyrhizobium]ERF80850.1 MAG: hypothetical protein C207_05937 [Bradyrhizobium sp. DFCI-1]QRI70211.1 hypothetical protein JQ507_01305 [Bradyrhizobium sp. PSBB068]MBR1023541.1 hypothetical protein [Bradyrhizobium viridifuturi]MBR1040418.1 hypothetical protein [Bradyrhizobium viridifuturi]MBR1047929.1 hypothetical protein [Bradyrhizobium viridifuturi]